MKEHQKRLGIFSRLLLYFIFSSVSLAGYSQSGKLDQRISITINDGNFLDALAKIKKTYALDFAYQVDELKNINMRVPQTFTNEKLSVVLNRLTANSNLQFAEKNDIILITRPTKQPATFSQSALLLNAQVLDGKGNPVAEASVTNLGNNENTRTDEEGKFQLNLTTLPATIRITHVSFETTTLNIKQAGQQIFTLTEKSANMQDVVVTALGLSRDKKQLGYAAQDIKGEQLQTAKETNMLRTLQGKVAGLNMVNAPSGLANSTRVVLRGESSLNINKNEALIVVDGVPINNTVNGSSSGDVAVDFGTGASEINPDDIESITVLKGPNAAALYGSRAANGVLVIKTKTASKNKQLGISINSSTNVESVLRVPDFQNKYGGGTGVGLKYYSYGTGPDGTSTANSGHNWGVGFNGQEYVQFGSPLDTNGNRTRIPWKAHPDNVRDFYQNGLGLINGISLQKAGDIGDFRISYNNLRQTGILPNTELNRHTLNLNSGINIAPNLRLRSNINYVNANSDNLPGVGYAASSPTYTFIWFERNADINWFKNYWLPGQKDIKQDFYFTWADNPYMVMQEHLNTLNRNRIYGNIHLDYDIVKNLSLMVRTGIDYSGDIRVSRKPQSTVTALRGFHQREDYTYFEQNSDFLLRYNTELGTRIKMNLSAGGNNLQMNRYNNRVTARELVLPGVYNLGNAASRPETVENTSAKMVNSLYAMAEFDYQNSLFLQVTGRNDWSSTLPKGNNSYFYPSVSMSGVLTDLFGIRNNWLNYWKLRASYASVGNDTDPYNTRQYYDYSSLPGSVVNRPTLANAALKPEISSSFETGMEAKFLKNRIGIDFTYYNTTTRNQIIQVPLATSAGYTAKVLNAGKITNHGVELSVRLVPIEKKLRWEINLNGSANRSEVVSLYEGISNYVIASRGAISVEAREGGRMGDMYGIGHQRTETGEIIYRNGTPQRTTSPIKIGNYNPDYIVGVMNSFRFANFNLNILFDGKIGGTIYSLTHATGSEAGSLDNTLPGREEGLIGDGVKLDSDGKYVPNDVRVPAYTYYRDHLNRVNAETNSFDATYFKLRELSFGYSLPSNLLRKTPFKTLGINLVGRNLFLFTNVPHIDPETATFISSGIIPGYENAQLPSTRSFGVNLTASF
jgi:TonB-linked SusC/RagA family outer membrane protein